MLENYLDWVISSQASSSEEGSTTIIREFRTVAPSPRNPTR